MKSKTKKSSNYKDEIQQKYFTWETGNNGKTLLPQELFAT